MPDAFEFICSLFLLEAAGCFALMLAYTIQVMPKSLMAVPVGITHAFMGLFALFCTALCLKVGEKMKAVFPISENRIPKMKMLILFHITFGVFIISDSLFGLENPPKTYNNTVSNTIANILHNFMIASAGIQAGGVASGIVAHFTKE